MRGPRDPREGRKPREDRARDERPYQPPLGAAAGTIAGWPEQIDLTIDKLVAGGDGFGRLDGAPVFVPRSAPGDRLRVRLTERRSDFARAEIVEIVSPGPGRRTPPCQHFGRCGGCDLQHLEDDLQVRLKSAAVLETLVRLGRLDPLPPLEVVTGEAWNYRIRTQLRTGKNAAGEVVVGYHARGTNDLVPVTECPILVPELADELARLPEVLGELEALPSRLDLAAAGGRVSSAPPLPGGGASELEIHVAGERVSFDARCFFQGHRTLLPKFVEVVIGPWRGARAIDLYAGVGLFALPLARLYGEVVAVEADAIGTRYARRNATAAPTLEVVHQAVESWLPHLERGLDRAIVDPPRGGLPLVVRRRLLECAPRRITYVSCHPAALARDLRELCLGYTIEKLTLVDLFPQTGHMELVAQLVAKES